jgi:acyl-coenzyme A synthetase/AMP-(fatty) acid ligase
MADAEHWLNTKIRENGNQLLLAHDGHEYSYQDLLVRTEEYQETLKARLKPFSVVCILSDYNFEAIATFIALMSLKCIIVPITTEVQEEINDRISEAFVDYIIGISDTGSLELREHHGTQPKHQLIIDLKDNNNAGLVLFSSGSTGKPKAMIHNLDVLCDSYKGKKRKSLRIMVFLMFDHIGGLNTMFNALAMGATMVIPSYREADHVCQLIEKYKVRILPASPTFLNMILMSGAAEKYDLKSLRMITYGTEAMPESLLQRIKESFPRTKLLQTFGTSETGIAQTVSKSSTSTFMKIDDPDVEYKIVNSELWLRSETQISGYLNAPMEKFSEDGWFKTGDLVEEDSEGYIRIIGRSSEVINVGGEKALPGEIESTILQMEEVWDCSIFPETNAITGQHVAVKVVLNQDIGERDAKKLIRAFCKGKLENYKLPIKVYVVDQLDVSARYKKQRR